MNEIKMNDKFRNQIIAYAEKVSDLAKHVEGNEQATRQSLIDPLFAILGYDLTDPRQCIPEYKTNFGQSRSTKPIDWAFLSDQKPIFLVEAKESGARLTGYTEQLGDYFAKCVGVKLGILTNGVEWKFFTDSDYANVMDKAPFLTWKVGSDEPPFDLLIILQKKNFKPDLIQTYVSTRKKENLLITEIEKLLKPSVDFMRLVLANVENRNLTESILESWSPIINNAITEWSKRRALSSVINEEEDEKEERTTETTQQELDGFDLVKKILGKERPVECEDTVTYFKVHIPGDNKAGSFLRFNFKRTLLLSVPLPEVAVKTLAPSFETMSLRSWTAMRLKSLNDITNLTPVILESYKAASQKVQG